MVTVVTGAAGFVGRTLVAALLNRGDTVVALDIAVDVLTPHKRLHVIAGDLGDATVRTAALAQGCDALVHLATVPGGAAEADPAASRRINVDAMYDLLLEATAVGCPRLVYASSIAVFGDPLPVAGVDDATPLAPRLVYGGHKAMMETAVTMMTHRGALDGVTVRLPGILARPAGPSGLKSAFMSDVFHALRAGRRFTCPVSAEAWIWAESLPCVVGNLIHAIDLDGALLPRTRAVTLPALRIRMADLVAEVARQCGASPDLVDYAPDAGLEAAFGAHPPLATPAAEAAGFRSDGDLPTLVARALARLG